jgi:lysophospholipase L1-like esterase/predicted small lipoprotein YifL
MKRILSLILASVMLLSLAACGGGGNGSSVTTTPEATEPKDTSPENTTPEDTSGGGDNVPEPIVYDFIKNFRNLEGSGFKLMMYHPVHGMITTQTKWYDGTDTSVNNVATGKPLVGYWTGNSDGFHVDVTEVEGNILWYPGHQLYNLIVFTAPVDGTYEYDFVTSSYFGCTHSSTAFRVEVDGCIHNANAVSYPQGTSKEDSVTNFTGKVSLHQGEMIQFIYDPENSVASDNGLLSKLQVTYVSDKMEDLPVFIPETPNNPIVEFEYENELIPVWTGNTVYDETVMFVGKDDVVPLLYPATEIISITNYTGTKTFTEGVDYKLVDGKLVMPEGSSLIYCPETTYWKKHTYDVNTYKDGVLTPTMAGPGNTLPQYQLKVTYKHNSSPAVTVEDKSATFGNVIKKLENGEDVTIIFFGDSITEGWDNSLKSGLAPHMPPWTALVVQYLANKYEYQVNYVDVDKTVTTGAWSYPQAYRVSFGDRGTIHYINTGVGGYTVQDAVQKVKSHVTNHIDRYGCDILFYAFGMNNFGSTVSHFSTKTAEFVGIVHEHSPETNIVLVSSMLPNSEQGNMGSVPEQEAALETLVANLKKEGIENVEVAPLQRVHKAIDAAKRYRDHSGNNMNHPGDYLHRVYAQVALQTICGYAK